MNGGISILVLIYTSCELPKKKEPEYEKLPVKILE